MKKLTLTLATLVLSLTLSTQAKANHPNHDVKSNPADSVIELTKKEVLAMGDVHVSVNGLVCDFCARALEKVFGKQDAVNTIDVNLDDKIITIDLKEGQTLDDATITSLIQDSGYSVEGIHHVQK